MADEIINDELIYFNGINGTTGDYGLPPMTGKNLYTFIRGEARPENLNELKFRYEQRDQKHFGVKEGIDPKKLSESGWGAIFPCDADPAVKEALSELIDLRREQAGEKFRIYEGTDGYRPGETKGKFLARHGMGPGPADPEKVPYYLLIVGDPGAIPYQFQYQLDVQYAVGRLAFDNLQEYANFARSIVEAEAGTVFLPRHISFFGVANPDDRATALSAEHLVLPLSSQFKNKLAACSTEAKPDWKISTFIRDEATKDQLKRLLGGEDTPALLFTASHGLEFPLDDPRQVTQQGALLCQDWPGPQEWQDAIPQNFYFAGDDLADDASLLGLMTFHFACYSGGTPLNDEFSKQAFKERQAIAKHPFVAGLAKCLLGHPRGGVLATIGHVERAWGYSFMWPKAGQQTTVFESTIERLIDGYPVGAAIEYFNERYAELASDLSAELEELEYSKQMDPYELAWMWTSNNDARSYIIVGDPAARLPVASVDQDSTERPVIEARKVTRVDIQSDKLATSDTGNEKPKPDTYMIDVKFGLRDMGQNITKSLKNFSETLAGMLSKAADDLLSLEVHTYTSDDLTKVSYNSETHRFDEAKLKALTRISLDGDMLNLVPERLIAMSEEENRTSVEIDENLWTIHQEMVKLAQENKVAFVKALAELASKLLETVIKP